MAIWSWNSSVDKFINIDSLPTLFQDFYNLTCSAQSIYLGPCLPWYHLAWRNDLDIRLDWYNNWILIEMNKTISYGKLFNFMSFAISRQMQI